jgi:hypothetical protein
MVETRVCEVCFRHFRRDMKRGVKPRTCPEHRGQRPSRALDPTLPAVARTYLGALDNALTNGDPTVRQRAGRVMREMADEMRADHPPGSDPRLAKIHPGSESFPEMRPAVQVALDQRICGES